MSTLVFKILFGICKELEKRPSKSGYLNKGHLHECAFLKKLISKEDKNKSLDKYSKIGSSL